MINNEDLEVDDLTENLNKKKKIKSGSKGKRGERQLVHELNARFADYFKLHPEIGQFSRSVGSGNRWGQNVIMSKNVANTYAGDITCPDKFKFVLESKNGYNDIDLCNCFTGKCTGLDDFLKQVSDDAARPTINRKPMLIWKKDRKESLAFIKEADILQKPDVYLSYNGWIGVNLQFILSSPDSFFFG